MPEMWLILIEGMVGAGKSTTAERLERWLRSRGEDARAFHEFAADHPIRTRAVDRLRAAWPEGSGPPAGDRDGGGPGPEVYAVDQWRRLAERCLRGQRTVILESSFLQNSVLPAFVEGAPARVVKETFSRIEREMAPARPLLIYLRPTDIAAAIARIHRERGEPWASRNVASAAGSAWARGRGLRVQEAVVALYRAWEEIVNELYACYSFPKLMLADPQHDWAAALVRIRAAVRPAGGADLTLSR